MNRARPVVAFSGGGTGGHIYPALAVAEELRALPRFKDARFFWIGSKNARDREIVTNARIDFYGVHSGKLRRYISIRNISDLFKIIAGVLQSVLILKKEKPDILFSKGGFASVPAAAAAFLRGVPVWTHESDFSPGLATRINAFFAERICVSYRRTAEFFGRRARGKIAVTGNPVRAAFYGADARRGRAFLGLGPDDTALLVLGGSQGAREINELVRAALPELSALAVVAHQTGGISPPPRSGGRYIVFSYIKDEMPDVLACAALVIGRSGAGMVWEAAAAGKPMILIPLSGGGTRGDQVENARRFEEEGAALCLVRPDAARLVRETAALLADPARLEAMARASARAGAGRPARAIAALLDGALATRRPTPG